jgi:hypothetical protein
MDRKDVEKALLAQGVCSGSITFEELNEALPAEYFPLQELEHFLRRLEALGIRVEDKRCVKRPRNRGTGSKE